MRPCPRPWLLVRHNRTGLGTDAHTATCINVFDCLSDTLRCRMHCTDSAVRIRSVVLLWGLALALVSDSRRPFVLQRSVSSGGEHLFGIFVVRALVRYVSTIPDVTGTSVPASQPP